MSKSEDFKQYYLEQIKALGYRVFVNPNSSSGITSCIIADEQGRVGHCRLGDFGFGVLFSTIHKPRIGVGASFGITDPRNPVFNIERYHIEECLAFAPSWVPRWDLERVEKFTLDEFLSLPSGKNYVELV